MVAYIEFLATGVPPGSECRGSGSDTCRSWIAPPIRRAAGPSTQRRARSVTAPDGSGLRRSLPTTDLGYMMPPLWGADSFNDGAGMARLITAANFIHFNMPHGADYLNPQLPVADAWDVAAYMVSQPRPHKAGLDKDFPDLLEKPVDAPYGPYADGFGDAAAQIRPVRADPRRAARGSRPKSPTADHRRDKPDRCSGNVPVDDSAIGSALPARLASIRSQIIAATSGPPRFLIARMPVGEVTLISVSKPSITSMPTNSSPRSRNAGPMRAQISRSRAGQVGFLRRAAAHHVGAQIVGRRHAIDRAGEFAVDQDDALVAVLHRRQEISAPPIARGTSRRTGRRASRN